MLEPPPGTVATGESPYPFAQNEAGGLMRRVKGGMGSLSEELAHAVRSSGATIRTNMPVARVVVENDANTATLGEARHGAGQGFNPVFYTTLGHPSDFENPAFRQLLLNAIRWAIACPQAETVGS